MLTMGGQRAGEDDGRDAAPADQMRRYALDPHGRRGCDDERIEREALDRTVDGPPREGEDRKKEGFERKKPPRRSRCRMLAEPELDAGRSHGAPNQKGRKGGKGARGRH